jgi:hypothetical protein
VAGQWHYLSDEDVAVLQSVLDRVRRDTGKAGAGTDPDQGPDFLTPEVHAARTSSDGLPGLVGDVLGSADCYVWRVKPDSGVMEDTGLLVTVYNRGAAVAADTDIFVQRDKFGTWFLVVGQTGAGSSTVDHVFVTSLTATGGLYPGKLQHYTATTNTWADTLDAGGGPVVVWFRPANGEAPPLQKRVLGQQVDTLAGVGVYAAPAPRSGNLRITSTTPGGPAGALYPANVETYSAASNTWSFVEGVWFEPSNGETPILNLRYAAERVDVTGGVAVYAGPAPSAGITTVKELDNTPTLTGVNTLILDQVCGLQLSQPSTGQAQVTIQNASPTQPGVVSTGTQSFTGNKTYQAFVTFQSTAFISTSSAQNVGSLFGTYVAGPPARQEVTLNAGTGGDGELYINGGHINFQQGSAGTLNMAFGTALEVMNVTVAGSACQSGTWTLNTPTGTVDLTFSYGWLTGVSTGTTTASGTTTTTTTTAGGGGGIPTVTNASPASATHGVATSITITGTNFTGTTTVRFGVASASFTVNSSTQITATTPTGLGAGSQPITVTNASGTSSGYAFTLT